MTSLCSCCCLVCALVVAAVVVVVVHRLPDFTLLPDVQVRTFHIRPGDVPEFDGDLTRGGDAAAAHWREAAGLAGFGAADVSEDDGNADGNDKSNGDGNDDAPIFLLIPSPAYQNDLDNLLRGLNFAYPSSTTCGGVASTVSSLSRARLFAYSAASLGSSMEAAVHGDGCAGVALKGDIRVDTMVAQGAKPVGGVYRVAAAGKAGGGGSEEDDEYSRSTIGAVMLDEAATEEEAATVEEEEEEEEEEEGDQVLTADERKEAQRARLLADYAKARIPKPPLAEANFVMRRLSDDDQAFMRKALLIGLERGGGSVGRTAGELARLRRGEGHRFTVRQVASAGEGFVPLSTLELSLWRWAQISCLSDAVTETFAVRCSWNG